MSPTPRTSWLARLFGNHRPKPVDDVPIDVELPTPLSTRRIGDYLSRRGYHFRIDDDGDVTGTWDGNRFWFLLLGEHDEILQVRGRWAGALPAAARLAVLQAANDWNRERIWPKTYVRVRDNGAVLVYTEVTVDLEHGVTEDQLDQLLQCGLTTGSMFFEHLDETFPDPLRSAP